MESNSFLGLVRSQTASWLYSHPQLFLWSSGSKMEKRWAKTRMVADGGNCRSSRNDCFKLPKPPLDWIRQPARTEKYLKGRVKHLRIMNHTQQATQGREKELNASIANHPALRLARQNAAERQAKGEVGPADIQGPVLLPQCQQERGQNDIKSAEALSI